MGDILSIYYQNKGYLAASFKEPSISEAAMATVHFYTFST